MTTKAYAIIGAIFVIGFALLGIGQCGYKELDSMRSLEKKAAKIRKEFPDVEHIESDTVAALLEQKKDAVLLVDCRTPEEFKLSKIPGAVNLEDLDAVRKHLADMTKKPTALVVYCSVGQRSAELAEDLKKAGIENAKNYVGSIFAWANEDRPLVDSQRPALPKPFTLSTNSGGGW